LRPSAKRVTRDASTTLPCHYPAEPAESRRGHTGVEPRRGEAAEATIEARGHPELLATSKQLLLSIQA
jgi:hypothetical protein